MKYRCEKGHKEPKHLPYGATKGKYWCWYCDAALVPEWFKHSAKRKNIKAKARQKSKKEISREMDELS